MANEHYTQEEALKKLALGKDDLSNLVREGRLREFRIDGQVKYKVSEIDALAAEINPSIASDLDASATDAGSESGLEVLPADSSDSSSSGDAITLEETGDHISPLTPSKEDTVITPAGVSVFDEDELAGLDADPMAKTQIAPSLNDELSIESTSGSKSGLLDMTRESDDTSLGAELLDEIYSGDETQPNRKAVPGAGEPAASATGTGTRAGTATGGGEPVEAYEEIAEPAVPTLQRVMMVEVIDPLAGMFNGLLVAAAILLGFSGLVLAGLSAGALPGLVGWLASNLLIWIIAAVVIVGAGVGTGFLLGRRSGV
jgi:hypothetical protein